MTLMGLVHNFEGLLASRMMLGLAEGGLFPGVTYLSVPQAYPMIKETLLTYT